MVEARLAAEPEILTLRADPSAAPEDTPTGHQDDDYVDLSGLELNDLNSFTFAINLTTLDLTQNRLQFIDPKLLALPNLKQLLMRQNLLKDMKPLLDMEAPGMLEELVLHDNQIEELISLEQFTGIKSLDVSFNQLRSIANAAGLVAAQPRDLYFASNKISEIQGLSELTNLRSLELGSNRLRSMEGINALVNLEELYVGRNKISSLEHVSGLTKLRCLSIQSNRIVEISGLETCTALEELYMSHNGVLKMQGLETLTNLNTLDIAANRLTQIEGLDTLSKLEHLWLNDNLLETLDGLEEGLRPVAATLNTIYLERNPAALSDPDYKVKVLKAAPALQQLDALLVKK
mmetsp:Transcript_35431/g.67816  ORF Transcript_35431/g.67816 Transcript_35431/m.67816 type:complete len:347 (-) Transcript_35431:1208-2248(-)